MAEKKSAKKLLALLLVLVALSLVVDLLSLNMLYDISKSDNINLKGGLFTLSQYDRCMIDAQEERDAQELAAKQKEDSAVMDARVKVENCVDSALNAYNSDIEEVNLQYDEALQAGYKLYEGQPNTFTNYASRISNEKRVGLASALEFWNENIDACSVQYWSKFHEAMNQYETDMQMAAGVYDEKEIRCGDIYDPNEESVPEPGTPSPSDYYKWPSIEYLITDYYSSYETS